MRAGADVVVEKPLTIDAEGCRTIAEARRGDRPEPGADLQLPLLAAQQRRSRRSSQRGAIGEVTSVHFEWVLDTVHGADYFRRWHREKEQLRRAARPQVQPPLRPRQLVARRRPRARLRQRRPAVLRATENAGARGLAPAPRARHRVDPPPSDATRSALDLRDRRPPQGPLPRRRAPRRLPARPGRLRRPASPSRTTCRSSSTTAAARR